MYDLGDTIVALATPPGVGAIGVIRLSGLKAIEICNACFPAKDLSRAASHTIHYGSIRNEQNRILDEVLVSLFIAPKSYTKENIVEVSCHGSPFILQQIIELFVRHGARMAKAGEFTLRAFLNGQMDLSQAEAVADLIASSSEASHTMAMQQMRGGFSNKIAFLREELINFASLIELELDFGEEDVEFANRDDLKALIYKIQGLIKTLMDSFQLGNVLKEGVNTVIAGRPNAGKSTLLNALLNEERAIVSEIAGTTRDTIEEVLTISGINFRFIDTAGIRDAKDKIEQIGVAKTMEKISQSTLLIYVFDAVLMNASEVIGDLKKMNLSGIKLILCLNKIDQLNANQLEQWFEDLGPHREAYNFPTVLGISAKSSKNIQFLKEELVFDYLDSQAADQTIVSNVRHYEALKKTNDSLQAVLSSMDANISSDFIAMDIRHSLRYLGEITGEISTDDLLANIFGKFCIGK